MRAVIGCWVLLLLCCSARAADVTVFAAASLTNALRDVATMYQADSKDTIRLSFAASSSLAKQVEAGAPADIFVSADLRWMDYLQGRGIVERNMRIHLLGNRLVLIVPAGESRSVPMRKGMPPVLEGRLCMAETGSVPAGIYGKQALTYFGWWEPLRGKVVGADDVRAVLAFVGRGECPLGIVYETDARSSHKVVIAGRFPAESHAPVIYPVALLPGASTEAKAFFRYLQGPEAWAVFARHGFSRPGR